jgi:hypothetical protein
MDDWIKKSHLGCKTCRQNRMPHLADVLDNLSGFKVHIQNGTPNALEVVDQLGYSYSFAKGADWVMEFSKNISPAKFEDLINPNRQFKGDIVEILANGRRKFYECKNWSFNKMDASFVEQMTNYFKNIESLDEIHYAFKDYIPEPTELATVLKNKKYRELIENVEWTKYEELFGPF